jgi:S-formylglutathione hydrolase FrmB
VLEDVIVTKKLAPPVILAMPYGSTSWLTDKEWANGVRPHENWETFVAKDVVDAIDKNYRTLPTGASRAIGGLSEGGYGALNIAVHHPDEFRIVESWSGYEKADNLKSIFGGEQRLLAYNSPLDTIRSAAPALRRAHTFFWFYSGRDDPFHKQNDRFAAELTKAHIAHRYLLFPGGHNWGLWRRNAMRALLVASRKVASG